MGVSWFVVLMLKMICLIVVFGVVMMLIVVVVDLMFDGCMVCVDVVVDGGFCLFSGQSVVVIGVQLMCSQIGSVMFDVLFVLVQQEFVVDCVEVICDFVFNQGNLVFCVCFQIGECWFYVWMCDVSFVVDLVLLWLDLVCIWQFLQFKFFVVCDGYILGLFVV